MIKYICLKMLKKIILAFTDKISMEEKMNKFKKVLLVIFAAVAVFAIALAAGCGNSKKLQTLNVDTSNAKTEYFVGQEFTAEGIVVTASLGKSETEIKETVTLNANEYTVDSSAYNKDEAGTYSIKVSYTLKDVTLEKSYDVTVSVVNFDGLKVTLADGTSDTVTLSAEATTALIDVTKIVVNEINPSDGTVGNVTTEYSVALYKGEEKITLTDNKANVGGGVYQIWVSKASEVVADSTRESFVNVYVVDDLSSIALKDGATLTQDAGEDVISATWNFTATYASGATKELTIADVTIEDLNTGLPGTRSATVTYTDVNATGAETSKSVEVAYVINVIGTVVRNSLAVEGTTWAYTADTDLAQTDFSASDKSFITLLGGTHKFRPGTDDGCLEIKNDAMSVTFTGSGTLTIQARSTGNANKSSIAVKGSDGKYVKGTYTSENVTPGKVGTTSENIYVVTSSYNEIVFTIDKADTYTICNVGSVETDTETVPTGRNTRIKLIETMDIIHEEGEVTDHNFSFDLNALANAAKGENALSDKMLVTADMFTGANAFLTFSGESTTSANNIRTDSAATKVTGFEMKNGALSVTFQGTGTISITFCSNGSSNTSCIGLKNSAGDLLEGVPSDAVNVTMNGNMYAVAGSKISYTVTYTITEAGTYTIWAGSEEYNRVARVSGITMVDKY